MNNLGNKDTMAKNILYYMSIHKISRDELSQAIGVPYTTLCSWMQAKAYPRIDKIEKMANYFGIQKADLVEEHSSEFGSVIQFPIIGTIAAGYNGQATEEYTGESVYFAASLVHSGSEYFTLQVKGDSMYPRLLDGDVVLVKRTTSVDSGQTAVVMYDGEDATVKRVNYVSGEDWLELVPINPEYKTRRIEGADLELCRVLGEVVALQRTL